MSLPNPSMTFTPFDPLPASDLNDLVENDQALAAGTGLDNLSIATGKIANSAVTPDKWTNPYKFSVYRSASHSSGNNTPAVVQFDAKSFDTSSNVDIVTNKGRFTAPVSGFYHLSARVANSGGSPAFGVLRLYKNGSSIKEGMQVNGSSATILGMNVQGLVQLTAGDYVEVYLFMNAVFTLGAGVNACYFDGHLVSQT